MKSSTFKIVAAITAFLAIIIFLLYAGNQIGLPANTNTQLIAVMPSIMVFFISVGVLIKTGASVFALPAFTGLGLGLALLLGTLEAQLIYPVASIAGGATLPQVQWLCIILCALVGGAVAAISRGRI
jgi:hypothetical protein